VGMRKSSEPEKGMSEPDILCQCSCLLSKCLMCTLAFSFRHPRTDTLTKHVGISDNSTCLERMSAALSADALVSVSVPSHRHAGSSTTITRGTACSTHPVPWPTTNARR